MPRGPYRVISARFSYEQRLGQLEQPPDCACGCGEKVSWDAGRCRWRRYAGRDHYRRSAPYKSEAWLRSRYVDDRMTMDEMAALCGVAGSTVAKFMKRYGIERRDRSESRRGRRTAEANHSWRGGVTPERQRLYKTPEWRALVRHVFARDGYRCRRCGAGKRARGGLHAHHVRPWSAAPDLRLDPNNLVTLCRGCHTFVHSAANTRRILLAA